MPSNSPDPQPRLAETREVVLASAAQIAQMVSQVSDWFAIHARPLPWRSDDVTPWGVLVSEVLSHQTQIERVVPKWQEFMRRWPAPAALAHDTDASILEFWDRLGYPRRALQLRRCAIAICDEHDGEVPDSVEVLESLPGIGPYTAGAVASFAYHRAVPAVDTNVRRVLARAICGVAAAWAPNVRRDRDIMLATLPTDGVAAAAWNASAMELGAVVCRSRTPDCAACPIAALCVWNQAGRPDNAPTPAKRQAAFKGSMREARGHVMALLRTEGVADRNAVDRALAYQSRFSGEDVVAGLIRDGLISMDADGRVVLGQ